MKKKWHPIDKLTQELSKDKYRYEFGWYEHEVYGRCFRISKYLKNNGYFIGHFVIVGEDADVFKDISAKFNAGVITQIVEKAVWLLPDKPGG